MTKWQWQVIVALVRCIMKLRDPYFHEHTDFNPKDKMLFEEILRRDKIDND